MSQQLRDGLLVLIKEWERRHDALPFYAGSQSRAHLSRVVSEARGLLLRELKR